MDSIGRNEEELKKHLIPDGKWSIVNFDDFLTKRKGLIKSKLATMSKPKGSLKQQNMM